MLYNGVSSLVAENLDALADEHIIPRFPAGSIEDHVQRSQSGELLLKGLREVWDDHVSNMTKLGQLLKYMVSQTYSFLFGWQLNTLHIGSNIP